MKRSSRTDGRLNERLVTLRAAQRAFTQIDLRGALLNLALAVSLTACGISEERDGAPEESVDVSYIPDAVPKVEARSRYGNPKSYVVNGRRYYVMSRSGGYFKRGIASWYGTKFHGRRTSSGESYDMYAMTAAHRTLPIPTYVQVTNLRNGRKIIVRVNDRGPFHQNRIIDLSYAGAKKLGIAAKGTGLVEVRAIDPRVPNEEPVKLRTASRSSDSSNFYLQVGAFAELTNAERLKLQLAAMGESLVRISQAVVSGQTFYRVRIGPIMSVEAADSLVDTLAELGIDNPHFVFD